MGLQHSKEELLYQQASYGNTEGIKSLRLAGAGLEWIDREGKTPLILACTKPDGLPVAKTLIELGANVNSYRPGYHGGTPLHHAAKKGLEPIVNLLLSHGANFLRVNDDCQTAIDLARAKGHSNVVRAIEKHICLFSGWLREISGPGFLEAIAPQWVSRKVWTVVLPCDHRDPMNFSKLELAIYPDVQAAQPRAVIALWKVKIEEMNINQIDPAVVIFDKSTKTRHKFLSANEGDKQQILWFYNACRGMPQPSMPAPSGPAIYVSVTPPSAPLPTPADAELAMAISASIQSAAAEGALRPPNTAPVTQDTDTGGWGDSDNTTFSGWGPPEGQTIPPQVTNGWADEPADNSYGGWAALLPEPGTSSHDDKPEDISLHAVPQTQDLLPPVSAPTTPPATEETFMSGPIHYPTIDLSPVDTSNSVDTSTEPPARKSSSISRSCVICLDAPVEGACIPCGHMAGCMSCLKEVKAKNWGCPVCRTKIEQVVKLYTV